jgi:hypothetical protein
VNTKTVAGCVNVSHLCRTERGKMGHPLFLFAPFVNAGKQRTAEIMAR